MKNNQTSGIEVTLLKKFNKKHVLRACTCLFLWCPHLATVFVTIQHNVFSNAVLGILRHVHFTEASFEPTTFPSIFYPFVITGHSKNKFILEFDICWGLTMIKVTCNFPLINQLFRGLLDPSHKQVGDYKLSYLFFFV